jgi:deoxyribonuclease V
MVLSLDVHYRNDKAKIVGVLFEWDDISSKKIIIECIDKVEEYSPGEFYKRELPCLLKIIEKVDLTKIEAIIIDGYVFVDNNWKYGLGGILWGKLDKKVPIIGVAKTSFFKNKETVKELIRGNSKKPLYVSTIDYPIDKAIDNLKKMSGEFRMPTILKQMDTITKE